MYVIALFTASIVFSSFCYVTIGLAPPKKIWGAFPSVPLSLRPWSLSSFHCFIICLLRHCSVVGFSCSIFCLLRHYTISSRFLLFHYLFVTSLLCSRLQVSPPFCYVTILFLQGFHCLIICLLRHVPLELLSASIVSSSACYFTIL